MEIETFELERYFARHEFTARYLLSCSDCEPLALAQLLEMADPQIRVLWDELKLSYTDTRGHPLLREEIASLYDGIGPDEVLALAPEEGIFLGMHALLGTGDHVVCTFPAYQSLHAVARSVGCMISYWEPDEDKGWRFRIRHLEKKLRSNTRLLVVNFPHNPTGVLPSEEDYRAVLALAEERGIPVFSDEMYRFLEIAPHRRLPSACDLSDRAVTLGGLSKSFGLPGLRLGWVASRDRELLDRIARLRDYTTICGGAPSEVLGIIALRNRDEILDKHRLRLHRNLEILERFFDRHPRLFGWNRPRGGTVCLPRMGIEQSTFDFCETMVRKAGIMLVPSRMFGFGERHVRIGLGRDDLPEVLERFDGYLQQMGR